MASVIRDGKLQQLDTFLFYKCHLLSNNPIKNLSVWVSRTGDGYLYFAIALLILWAGTPHGESFFIRHSPLLQLKFQFTSV
ncbi:hypothetical protein [Psychrosphaera algicola]|uniref:Uncharacterized protein n=1 Tax=Psychrosphaera algicola TaxID=3023714 RepID=A0ABT5FEE9_9GAMM|nr:hypothetical protein [Psychrosphaera sp. G1-22]MDC2889444.1 hypothetical protein [Psychrosphaera sp. G1-22]